MYVCVSGDEKYFFRSFGLVIPNPDIPYSKSLESSNVDSVFHTSEVDKVSTRNFWELSGKK